MKRAILFSTVLFFAFISGTCRAQTTPPGDSAVLAPDITMRTTGGIDIGPIYAEVVQFGEDWKESEEHDVFKPDITTPDANTHVATGTFTTPSGDFKLTEKAVAADDGIDFSASVTSDKEVSCNELSVAFNLPVDTVGGKQIVIDGQPLTMPMEPAKQGEAHLFDKEGVQKIEIPTPKGTLTITGNVNILVQDDREWGDKRFGLRLQFTPGQGAIKSSKIEFKLAMKTANDVK